MFMLKRRLALLPVDARPVTSTLPKQIAEIGGWEVLLPPKEILGFLKRPGDVLKVKEWLEDIEKDVEGFVVSADMLCYGGLVPSRVNEDPLPVLLQRLNLLKSLKTKYPEKRIYAFSATMRISNNYVNEEEKEYWSDYGVELYQYSYHSHRYARTYDEESGKTVSALMDKIPAAILEDYLSTREKNFLVNQFLLQFVEEGIIDRLVFPQDDTSEYGLNIQEQETLAREVRERCLFQKVAIYPGADEVACSLTARMILELERVQPPRFYPFYSGEKGALIPAMYEDRSIAESVKGQIFALGSHTVSTAGEADILLAVNVPGKKQGDLALQLYLNEVDTPDRNIGEWISRIHYYAEQGCAVGIADVAYANGSDAAMIPELLDYVNVTSLCGYAGWNTAGNTIGTVVAQTAMHYLEKMKGLDNKQLIHNQLYLRLLDDYVYQSIVRQDVRKDTVDEFKITSDELCEKVKQRFMKEAHIFLKGTSLSLSNIYLPWNRTFEICFELASGTLGYKTTSQLETS
jgi:hypothetical protein